MNRLNEIETRKAEIKGLLENGGEVNLEEMETEIRGLNEEKEQIEKRTKMAEAITARTVETKEVEGATNPEKEEREKMEKQSAEQRGKELMENRSVTVGSSDIVLPKHQATDIKRTFNEVSTLIDRVHVKNLIGGESFTQPYLKGYGEGDHVLEGADYATAEPVFGYADIGKSKVTAYAEDSEETTKLPAADYDAVVVDGITVATRKKLTKEILVGTGATNRLTGIFSANATAIDPLTDKGIEVIDETTLDEIVYSYGGDEDVEDVAVLILNKKDLKKFATLRDADGDKVYDVVNNGNTGTIDGVPFILNSACKAISDSATVDGEYAMAYGSLSNYTMAVFSQMDVQRSSDFKFKQGMIAHKGVVFSGGNVTAMNGFLRVSKVVPV
ncbi:phage major capsid protein [Salipaludibacillus sp. CF4.18]|uniref:phage major capsid protein n=1 Tax=Salipaludibacillus sp. CF4.18 TaxID=3373081 RepID=UPI003EE75743